MRRSTGRDRRESRVGTGCREVKAVVDEVWEFWAVEAVRPGQLFRQYVSASPLPVPVSSWRGKVPASTGVSSLSTSWQPGGTWSWTSCGAGLCCSSTSSSRLPWSSLFSNLHHELAAKYRRCTVKYPALHCWDDRRQSARSLGQCPSSLHLPPQSMRTAEQLSRKSLNSRSYEQCYFCFPACRSWLPIPETSPTAREHETPPPHQHACRVRP